jgi:hypothetical protein
MTDEPLTPAELAQQDQILAHAEKTINGLRKLVLSWFDEGRSTQEMAHDLIVTLSVEISQEHLVMLFAALMLETGKAIHEGDWA